MSEAVFSTWGHWTPGRKEAPHEAPAEFGPGAPLKAFMGWDGLIINDDQVNVVDMTRAYIEKAKAESCGQCFPCRLGTERMTAIINRICDGQGRMEDLTRLETLARQVKDSSKCDIGQTFPRPVLDALTNYRDEFAAVIKSGQQVERSDYAAKVTAPCMNACPSHVDIPAYIEQIRFGRWDKALEAVRRDCPMPGSIGRVCVRPCEFNCRRGKLDEPIAIKPLKRFAADQELAAGVDPSWTPADDKQAKVAIIGAGPAGLACAYYLGLKGYKSTVFEALEEPGGMAAVGIPDYRLPRNLLRREAELCCSVGAEIKYGVNIGVDKTIDDLKAEGYKAIFVGVGAPEASSMRCEGEDAGYMCFKTGVEFLREVALGNPKPIDGKKMVVIGGGNVAMDCVRTALRTGFTDVNLVYRRTRAEMPADPVEIEEAHEEGVIFHYLIQPIEVMAENNKVTGLKCLKMELGEPDASGRRRPVPIEGSEFVIEADAVVPAIGQICVVDCVLPEASDAELTKWKTIVVDGMTFQSGEPSIFGGGDCATGPATYIAALAAGKKAAKFIDQYIESGACQVDSDDLMEKLISDLGVFCPTEDMPYKGQTNRVKLTALEPEERIKSFAEVEAGPAPHEALAEAERCLRCYRIGMAAY